MEHHGTSCWDLASARCWSSPVAFLAGSKRADGRRWLRICTWHTWHTQTKSNDHEWSLSEAHNSRCGIGESDWINLNQSESVQKNPRSTSEIFRDRPMFWALGISWLPLMGGRDVRAKCQASWNAARLFPRSYATWSSLSHQTSQLTSAD